MDIKDSQAQVGTSDTSCGIAEKASGLINQSGCSCPKNVFNPSDSPLSMPVCFLVREQAKSLIAIQDLQQRLENIEGFQNDFISVIGDVQNYLSHDIRGDGHIPSSGSSLKKKSTVIRERPYCLNTAKENELQLLYRKTQGDTKEGISCSMTATARNEYTAGRPNYYRPKNDVDISGKKIFDLNKTKDSAPESDKQDSGLDSDCRDQGQDTSISQNAVIFSSRKNSTGHGSGESDELLELLNEIGRKGEALQKRIAIIEEKSVVPSNQSDEIFKIQNEHQEFHHILSEVRKQVDSENKLYQSENGNPELLTEKGNKNMGLHSCIVGHHNFDNRGHKAQTQVEKTYLTNNITAATVCSGQQDMVEIANEKSVHKVNGAKVSSILKENSVLELRKQVLLYLMENEILHTKLFQTEQLLSTKSDEWQKAETFLNVDVKNLMQGNQDLHITLEGQKLEIIALKSKVRMLERVLQAVTVENRELNFQLGETLGFGEALQNGGQPLKKSFLDTNLSHSESGKPRRSSLPAKLCSQQETSLACTKSQLLPNARSSIDVSVCGQQCMHENFEGSSTKQKISLINQVCQQPELSSPQSNLPANPLIRHYSPSFATTRHNDCLDELIKRTLNSELSSAKTYEIQRKGKEPNSSQNQTAYADRSVSESSSKTSIKRISSDNICKPLEPIKEKSRSSTDSAKFPFYSILEKLKPSADYKLRKNLRPELSQISESETTSNQAPKNTLQSSSNQKLSEQRCSRNQGKTSSSAESDHSLVEECKRMYPGFDKNFHKRMQDFLDRITAESDEAMV